MIQITGIPLIEQRPLPPMPTVRLRDLSGGIKFYIGVNLTANELSKWSPQKITNFFNGVAQVVRTVNQQGALPQ